MWLSATKELINGEMYLQNSKLAGRPDLQRRVRDIVAQIVPRVEAVNQEFSDQHGWTIGGTAGPVQHAVRSDLNSQQGIVLGRRGIAGTAPAEVFTKPCTASVAQGEA